MSAPVVVPLMDLYRTADAQVEDIQQFLRRARIRYHISKLNVPARYIYVRESDYARARQVIKEESEAFSLKQREEWEREWREGYKGSYWTWLKAQRGARAKLGALRLLLLV